jgi:hypothetical protein
MNGKKKLDGLQNLTAALFTSLINVPALLITSHGKPHEQKERK